MSNNEYQWKAQGDVEVNVEADAHERLPQQRCIASSVCTAQYGLYGA